MNQLLFYLLQVVAASGLLYSYYHLALRNKKFHRYNRFYLLMAVVISSLIPFLNIPVYFSVQESESSVMLQTLHVISYPAYYEEELVSASATWFTFQNVLYLLYFIILAVFLIRILFSLNKIRSLIRENTSERLDKIRFVNTDEPGTPFSFFRWLFWNRKIELHSEKGEQIFRHELFHIQQKHSWDIIFVELITVIFWINPFFHLIKRELKAIHEFLADEFAIKENNNWQYAELLLMQAFNTNNHLVNPFFHNQIKRRIAMITTSTKPSYQYLRKLMVFPVAAIIIFLFAFSYQNKRIDPHAADLKLDIQRPTIDTSKQLQNALIIINGVVQEKRGIQNIDTTKLPTKEFKGSVNVSWGKEAVEKYGEIGKDGVIEFFYDQHGDQIRDTIPKVDTIYLMKDLSPPAKKSLTKTQLDTWKDSKIYGVWIDGNRISNADLEKYKPSDFGWYNVSKLAKNAINYGKHYYQVNLYSQKYYDEKIINGKERPLILIRDATHADTTKPVEDKPIIVIDGKLTTDMNVISPNDIEKINVLKGKNATDKYGEKAKNGVIEIVTNRTKIKEIETWQLKPAVDDDNKVFEKVEVEAAFRGGEKEWRNYLNRNLDVNVPLKNGCKPGTYTVVVQFIVAKDGSVSDVKALTNHGFGMEEEAMRMIRKGPGWIPAIQNGHNVKAYRKQPFTFVIDNGKPNNSKSITKVKSFENDENIVFEKVETEASFPGGVNGWREFLQKNLKSTVPVDSGAKAGTYTVIAQFIVHKDGSISDPKTLTNHGHGMESEVLRVMKRSPNWIPAMHDGCAVSAYRKQPVTFVIAED